MKTKYVFPLFCILAVGTIVISCKENEEVPDVHRLFKPQVTSVDNTVDNQLTINWLPSVGVTEYKIDLALDSACTQIEKSVTVKSDVSSIVLTDVKAATQYYVRIQAISADPDNNSKFRILPVTTSSIFVSNSGFILDNSFILKWIVRGLPVTKIKVKLNSADQQYPLAGEFDVSGPEAQNGLKTVSGFKGNTEYLIELYSGELIRGKGTVRTKPSILNSIDLRDIDPTRKDKIFNDTILKVPDGAIIVLKRGETYNLTSSLSLSKSVSFISGYSFIQDLANIIVTKNFTFLNPSNIRKISFTDLNITGSTNGAFFIVSQIASCNVDTISFDRCHVSTFRGALRLRGSENVNHFLVNNCLIDSTSDYGFISIRDAATNTIRDISIKNSTVYRARRFIQATKYLPNTPQTTVIENCTFYNSPFAGNMLLDYGTDVTMQASVSIKNCLFGWAGTEPPAVPGSAFRVATSMTLDADASNYITSDFYFTGIPMATVYSGNSKTLFKDPAKFDFTLIDSGFSGRKTAGDPRWR
jgi:hypothetical protein